MNFYEFEGDLHQLTKGMRHTTKQTRSEIKEKDLQSRSDRHLNVQVSSCALSLGPDLSMNGSKGPFILSS